jgi:hypothetical protein
MENTDDLFQKIDRENKNPTIETDFQSNRDSFAVTQLHISAIAERFDGKLERILYELEKMTKLVKYRSKKYPSNRLACIEALIE